MTTLSYAQHLGSARAIGAGGFTAFAGGVASLDWNPAGLSGIHEWEIEATNFFSTNGGKGPSLYSAAIGKRFSDVITASLRISPGSSVDLIIPSTFTLEDSSRSLTTKFDKEIKYSERYALGLAFSVGGGFTAGASVHSLQTEISDTRYALDSNAVIQATPLNSTGNVYAGDVGVAWSPDAIWRIGLVVKNSYRISESSLDEQDQRYALNLPAYVRGGVSFAGAGGVTLGVEGDTEKKYRAGGEWTLWKHFGGGYQPGGVIRARGGLYMDGSSSLSAEAFAVGLGGTFLPVQIDLSYLGFFDQTNRRGTSSTGVLQSADIRNIDYNAFTGDRMTLTARVNFGSAREITARIEYVEIAPGVFPASQTLYALSPIGKARVRNTTAKPIEVKVRFFVDRFMDAPTETRPVTIAASGIAEIPFYAVLNGAVGSNRTLTVCDGEVSVSASTGDESADDRYQARILVHGRNDWNGDASLLKFFVTSSDSDVMRFTRATLNHYKPVLDTIPRAVADFERARIIFGEFAERLLYVNDPKQSQDFVQYPGETLSLRGGDCDDLSVCYSALLASMGIATAFVDVVPPAHPEDSHIYVMFDTGIDPQHAHLISSNPKRYVVRKNERGGESVWIPVETTSTRRGFEDAWNTGAQEYFNDVEVNFGLAKGWVRVVDLENVN
jgi:hypothetical protein